MLGKRLLTGLGGFCFDNCIGLRDILVCLTLRQPPSFCYKLQYLGAACAGENQVKYRVNAFG